jgi:hypothetical protein
VDLETKRARFANSGLLEFEGPVSLIFRLISLPPKITL